MPSFATPVMVYWIRQYIDAYFKLIATINTCTFKQEKFTLPILVQQMQGVYKTDYGVVYLGVTLSVVPILLLFMFCSKKILESSMSGAVKG